jgi:hypothetical protein
MGESKLKVRILNPNLAKDPDLIRTVLVAGVEKLAKAEAAGERPAEDELDNVEIVPLGKDRLYVYFNPIEIHGVSYRASVRLAWITGEWRAEDEVEAMVARGLSSYPVGVVNSVYMRRLSGPYDKRETVSNAAIHKAYALATTIAIVYHAVNPVAFRAAEVEAREKELAEAEREVAEAREKLEAALDRRTKVVDLIHNARLELLDIAS